MQRVWNCVWIVLVGCGVLAPQPAAAAFISLGTPLTGLTQGVEFVDLTVSFDPDDSGVTNLLGHDLYVEFSGLTVVAGSHLLGSVYDGLDPNDVLVWEGLCVDLATCAYPPDDFESPDHYVSSVALLAPTASAAPGTVFTVRFAPLAGATTWSLDLFGGLGDFDDALFWEPQPAGFEPIQYVIVTPVDNPVAGFARLIVSADVTDSPGDPDQVPEPSLLLLVGAGLVGWRFRR